ncbi:MAG: N-6 DNA methylase [Terriglobia bacterium]
MKEFRPYVERLEFLVSESLAGNVPLARSSEVLAALNGQPKEQLRSLVPIEQLRGIGAFFTGAGLARRALRLAGSEIGPRSAVYDPACGAGDLLVGAAEHLPIASDLSGTMRLWADVIHGRDLDKEFVAAARLRLMLAALKRGAKVGNLSAASPENLLPGVESGCGLLARRPYELATHIIVNPPFTLIEAPEECTWACGKVNSAAVFMESCIAKARPATRVVAILPEVLRTGSRYEKWRENVTSKCIVERAQIYGQFDRWTDVDVFILVLRVGHETKQQRSRAWFTSPVASTTTVGDHFKVSVGPVVPHRDPLKGLWRPFICSRTVSAWAKITKAESCRRFAGTVFQPPFVVVRRTSRPGDRFRAVGTIIGGQRGIAAENHLLVLEPNDGTVRSCRKLLDVLKRPETNAWLDRRIRCRHLTVGALRELPWWDE